MEGREEGGLSRRSFLKSTGMGVMGLAAAAGAFGLSGCASEAQGATTDAAGIGKFDESIYTDVFPVKTRNIPVRDVEVGVNRRGNVAFEAREIADSEIVKSETCDVLVIGCGITGSCAALSASDEGASVICVEKMDVGRGMFEAMGTVGGKVMTEAGNIVDRAEMVDKVYFAGSYRLPVAPARLWVERSGEAADWLQERLNEGEYGFVEGFEPQKANAAGFEVPQTELTFTSDKVPPEILANPGGVGIYMVRDLTNVLKSRSNVDLRFNTPAVQLRRDESGRVVGAIIKSDEGYSYVEATGGVILATGGYDANPEMLKAWCRAEDIANSSSWCPNLGTTGDGHLMGLQVGGQMDPVPHAVMNFNWGSPDAFYAPCFGIVPPFVAGIMVNERGERFCNENLPYQAAGNAITAQKDYGAHCWTVFSADVLGILGAPVEDVQAALEPFFEKGWCVSGDSLDALAEEMGVPADALNATVERYNGFVAAGKDQDFNKAFSPMNPALAEGPYYAIRHQQTILATGSGLIVDYSARVLDYDNEVIPGLYAAGNASGGMFSGNYPRHIFGPSVGRCVTFGYVAGQNAAREA